MTTPAQSFEDITTPPKPQTGTSIFWVMLLAVPVSLLLIPLVIVMAVWLIRFINEYLPPEDARMVKDGILRILTGGTLISVIQSCFLGARSNKLTDAKIANSVGATRPNDEEPESPNIEEIFEEDTDALH